MHRTDLSAASIVEELRRNGMVCLPSFFDRPVVETMRGEALALLDRRPQWRIVPNDLDQRFPALDRALNADLFKQIAGRYDPKGKFFTSGMVEHETTPGKKITDIHFDMNRSLKFMIYLSDVDRASAAFRYAPGSHHENRKLRNRFLLMGGRLRKLPNIAAPGERIELQDMEGPAGTLIIFDTDGFHSAGVLEEGKERLLVRGHSQLSSWFDRGVLSLAAGLNPLQFLAPYLAPEGRTASRGFAKVTPKRKQMGDDTLTPPYH